MSFEWAFRRIAKKKEAQAKANAEAKALDEIQLPPAIISQYHVEFGGRPDNAPLNFTLPNGEWRTNTVRAKRP